MSTATQVTYSGFERAVSHIGGFLTLSETESRRIFTEISHAILIGCCLEGSVVVPRLGLFWYDRGELQFKTNIFPTQYAADLKIDLTQARFVDRSVIHKSVHQTDPTRDSICDYLKFDYGSEGDWTSPKGNVYTHAEVKAAITKVKKLNDDYNDIFVARMLATRRRYTIASAFLYSEASIKRRCDAVVASILLLLIHPELTTDSVAKLYRR